MRTEDDQLELAKWILERNLHWVGAAEVKTAVVVAVATAMLGTLAAAYGAVPAVDRVGWTNCASIAAAAFLLFAMICAGASVWPRTDGPKTSFVFFGKIASQTAEDYAEGFRKASTDAFVKDFVDQIHVNAQIANKKFSWVSKAMGWTFTAMIPWVIALCRLTKAFTT